MLVPMRNWRGSDCLMRLEQHFNSLVDSFFEAHELERIPFKSGIRAKESKEEVVVEIAFPFAPTGANVEVHLDGRILIIRYVPPESGHPHELRTELWCDVEAEGARATTEGNVLVVTLPKRRARSLRILVEEG